ncbi:MAG TPA: T9SS type A sorting domain-containing protein [Chitinophagales bacterium]|nr:T9SS type A sorting domain-containing protein [Chitinophagales bacterium]
MAVLSFLCWLPVQGQFAPAAGLPGSTAIPKDSSAFVEWATGCDVQRGFMNIADTALGYASVGSNSSALGKAGENGVVSLGDGGIATLTFNYPVYNGPGFDFAVFENGFTTNDSNLAFLEFAFVEVSSDGVNFFRFPATSNIQDTTQLVQEGIDCSLVNNLAGTYVANYGTPFDLDDLAGTSGLDVNNITHIRVIDVVGSIQNQYATYDMNGHKINDPWPTPFASCGFDLDAIGVIHANVPNGIAQVVPPGTGLFPNPVKQGQITTLKTEGAVEISVSDLNGREIMRSSFAGGLMQLNTTGLSAGLYLVNIVSAAARFNTKLIVQ